MVIIPAIDLKDGKCVRLEQGDKTRVQIFSEDPVKVGRQWEALGAEMLHVVDLDGAFTGEPQNESHIDAIVKAVKIPVQVGGGLRDLQTLERYLERGVARVILGTTAYQMHGFVREACERFPGRILASIDAREGMVAIEGWTKVVPKRAEILANELKDLGVSMIIYTDILKEGMMGGPNFVGIRRMAELSSLPIIASGGFAKIEDLEKLKEFEDFGVVGAVLGKSLYLGTIDLREAIEIMRSEAA
ncbi:MAG: 1-(5-phosphoribosyl)-5-[(5-phosphoribosylamino)methylideneamino]imidazole-4-carboxamide isomerase [Deltaproteobacteria bacterium]|nr:1-(5-phosphoribosyl)-5-[(5-phosphoribosylamino)methylideneamino]imidazole-4-carboxamide isomerase [Deltaproteobacteria bacterium]